MYTALVSAGASAQSGFPVTNLLVIIGLLVVGWPLFRKVRKSASENRKRRWVQEGLMKPPNTDAESEDRSAEPGAG